MSTHSSILAWRIPWTEAHGGLQSIGSQRVRENWSEWACSYTHTHTHTHTHIHIYIFCLGEGACVTQWSYEHAMQGHPTWMGHSEEFWQNMVQLEEEIATHSSILAWRTPRTVWKIKRIWHWKMSPTGQNMPIMLLGKSGEQLQIA